MAPGSRLRAGVFLTHRVDLMRLTSNSPGWWGQTLTPLGGSIAGGWKNSVQNVMLIRYHSWHLCSIRRELDGVQLL